MMSVCQGSKYSFTNCMTHLVHYDQSNYNNSNLNLQNGNFEFQLLIEVGFLNGK